MLSSIPLLCYMGAGNWKAFILGSGTYGFGLLDISLDWNYISFFSPMYTPLWANANRFAGAIFSCWILYPIMYFSNIANTQNYAAMSSGTWDKTGAKYNISLVLNSDFTLNKTAMNLYSMPKWSASYAMHFFWGFASSTAVLIYCLLFHANSSWKKILKSWRNERTDYDDPYLKLTAHLPRVPHWWYASLLGVCVVFAALQLYMSQMQLPFWGLLLITALSALFTLPSGLLFGFTNVYVGMEYLSELLAGFLFPGKPIAVLTSMVYGRQVLAQCLNMISDIKFGFYMKIPEHELFYAQVYGTLLGPFVNWACMRLIIDLQGPKLTGEVASNTWNALKTKNFYSLSVIWGVIGPSIFFSQMSDYGWIYYGFVVGIASVVLVWLVQRRMGYGDVESYVNPVLMFNGASIFPIYTTTNLMTSVITAFLIMGYTYRVHTGWFHKYNYLIGAGLDCGSQLVQVGIVFVSSFPAAAIPSWWGNNAVAVDRCFPPSDLPKNALN
ncbi:OPT family small oligopeptide transporter [Phlyctema vagabunda]|uniref:OPT family small oligopeptide transporter n=1 Tax=Phlyctema vagabunda TaxID=108571 RepID=A0ABR4PRJ3_9HELO